MNHAHTTLLPSVLACLLAACGATGSAGTGAGGSGAGGSTGTGGDMPGNDASVDDGDTPKDARSDRIVTCEGRDGNTCMVMPNAPACERCIQSCCCDRVAMCRANADCAAAIGRFNDCIQQGSVGVACLVVAVETLPDAALFTSVAECVNDECGDLTCRL